MTDDARERTDELGEEKAVLEAVIERDAHPYRTKILKRLLDRLNERSDALRDSEGREVVAEGFITSEEALPNGGMRYGVETIAPFPDQNPPAVTLIRRQEAESDTDRGGEVDGD